VTNDDITNPYPPAWFDRLSHHQLADILHDPHATLSKSARQDLFGNGSGAHLADPQDLVGLSTELPDHLPDAAVKEVLEARAHLDAWWDDVPEPDQSGLKASKKRNWNADGVYRDELERLGPMGEVPRDGKPLTYPFRLPVIVRAYLEMLIKHG
jgi:hypothetical protein